MPKNPLDNLNELYADRPVGQTVTATLRGELLGKRAEVTVTFDSPDNLDISEVEGEAVRLMLESAFHAVFGKGPEVSHEAIDDVELDITGEPNPEAVEEANVIVRQAIEDAQAAAEKARESAHLQGGLGMLDGGNFGTA